MAARDKRNPKSGKAPKKTKAIVSAKNAAKAPAKGGAGAVPPSPIPPQTAPGGPIRRPTTHGPSSRPNASYSGTQGGRLSTPWDYSSLDPRQRYGTNFDRITALNRARDLQNNNPIIGGIIDRMADSIVGDGFRLQVLTDDDDYNERAEALINGWLDSADSSGVGFLESCRGIIQSKKRDGDVFVVLLKDGTFQVIEGDLVGNPLDGVSNKTGWIDGVKFSLSGKPSQYSILTVDPQGKTKAILIDAADCIYYGKRKRSGQARSISEFVTVFNLIDQVDGWIEATVVGARVAASYSLVVKKNGAAFTLGQADAQAMANQVLDGCPVDSGDDYGSIESYIDDNGNIATRPAGAMRNRPSEIKVAPGMVNYLDVGESIEQLNPNQPSQNFPDSSRAFLRILGAGVGMNLEQIIGDYSTVSGAAARVALQQGFRPFKIEQRMFTDTVLARLYRWRISKFVKEGLIEYRADMFNHRWIPPAMPVLDPQKELLAELLALDLGKETRTSLLQKAGSDFPTWLKQTASELEQMREAGVPITHSQFVLPYDNTATVGTDEQPTEDNHVSGEDSQDGSENLDTEGLEDGE